MKIFITVFLVLAGGFNPAFGQTGPVPVTNSSEDFALYFEGGGVFAGTDADFAEAPNSEVHSGFDRFTVEAWFMGYGSIAGNESASPGSGPYGNSRAWTLRTEEEEFAEEAIEFIWYYPGRHDLDILRVEHVITDPEQWYHVAVTFDRGDVRMYLDGEEIGRKQGISRVMETDHPLTFGARPDWSSNSGPRQFQYALTGQLTEIRTWSEPRMEQEIQANKGVRLSGTEPGLTSYYPMNEGTGDVARDKVAANDAVIYGAEWVPLEGLTLPEANPDALPGHVTLSNPPDGTEDMPVDLILTWQASANTDSYEIQVSENSAFAGLVIHETGLTQTRFQADEGVLNSGAEYFWRVRAVNNNGESEWTEPWKFLTVVPAPEAVALVSPENSAENMPAETELIWEETPDADTWHVQISGNSGFSPLITDSAGITDTTFFYDGYEETSTYYWRVRAENEQGSGNWSDAWSFTTSLFAPEIARLLFPFDGSEDLETDIGFSWLTSVRAGSYRFQVTDDGSFNQPLIDSVLTDTLLYVEGLEAFTEYRWRVQSMREDTIADWSEVWSFTTGESTGTEELAGLPREFGLDQNYPNPFNPSTTIRYRMPESGEVRLEVYDLLGRRVAVLIDEHVPAGYHEITFSAAGLAGGVYFYRLQTGSYIQTKSMTLVK